MATPLEPIPETTQTVQTIPVILKGDTSSAVQLMIASGYDYTNKVLNVSYQGVTKEFTDLVAGETKLLQFSADETESFALGGHPVRMALKWNGNVQTIPSDDVKIKVTDCASEVYDAQIVVRPSGMGVSDLVAKDSLGAVKSAVNEILAYLRSSASAIAILACASLFGGVIPKFVQLNDLPGDTPIMTNIVEYVSGNGGGGGGINTNAVNELIASATNGITASSIGAQTSLSQTQMGVVNGGPYLPTSGGVVNGTLTIGDVDDVTQSVVIKRQQSSSEGCSIQVGSASDCGGLIKVLGGGYEKGGEITVLDADDGSKASIKKGGKEVATEEFVSSCVTQVVRSVVQTVWDEGIGVAWDVRAYNGNIYYIAVTNRLVGGQQ